MKSRDVKYKVKSEADHEFELDLLDEIMAISNFTDTQVVVFTINLRSAIDKAYSDGMDAGYG